MAIEHVLVPYSFLGFDTIVYLIAAVIGFLVAYNASKVFGITSKRSHMFLSYGFTILSIGFLILAVSSGYTYANMRFSNQTTEMQLFAPAFDVYDFGYWIYYAASIVAYIMFIMMYLPGSSKGDKRLFFILPYWFVFFPFFQLISLLLISYVAFRSAANYFEKRSRGSLFVMTGFACFAVFHLLMLFAAFGKVIYVVAHAFLIIGALSLLMVLTRAGRKRKIF
jgi:hypothetical protein